MKYLNPEQLKALLKAEQTTPVTPVTDPIPAKDWEDAYIGEWWDPNFGLMYEKDAAFQWELVERADRLNAGLWPFT